MERAVGHYDGQRTLAVQMRLESLVCVVRALITQWN